MVVVVVVRPGCLSVLDWLVCSDLGLRLCVRVRVGLGCEAQAASLFSTGARRCWPAFPGNARVACQTATVRCRGPGLGRGCVCMWRGHAPVRGCAMCVLGRAVSTRTGQYSRGQRKAAECRRGRLRSSAAWRTANAASASSGARDLGRYGEIWGDLGRSGEMWGDLGRCSASSGACPTGGTRVAPAVPMT